MSYSTINMSLSANNFIDDALSCLIKKKYIYISLCLKLFKELVKANLIGWLI